jgi:hypothetical protein
MIVLAVWPHATEMRAFPRRGNGRAAWDCSQSHQPCPSLAGRLLVATKKRVSVHANKFYDPVYPGRESVYWIVDFIQKVCRRTGCRRRGFGFVELFCKDIDWVYLTLYCDAGLRLLPRDGQQDSQGHCEPAARRQQARLPGIVPSHPTPPHPTAENRSHGMPS